ncbi:MULTISPECIES: hypothetical protein [unclassified Streptomyces]|uniref:hypothetical protein n=1 Tax=unclassified Streptomyces TaxID=2593676 RepID=UPI001F0363C9|nr:MULTISPECIES: hypothetical protein [unclassified Streptomyces]MCH0566199.1 hypothetical protein [Streptomyces sp. MUM 2J]MCH0568365.1 hypothetical protein [Streptomyces sp. MUM 136J]
MSERRWQVRARSARCAQRATTARSSSWGEERQTPCDRPPLSRDFLKGDVDAAALAPGDAEEYEDLDAQWLLGSPTAVSRRYAPASGRVLAVDTALAEDPGAVNAGPCTGGWLLRTRVENIAGAPSADAYAAHRAHTRGVRR